MDKLVFSSIFGELTKQVQVRIDAASSLNKQLFDQSIYERVLTWDTPTVGLNFEEIIGKYNLSIAAATIDENAKEPVRPSAGLETLKEKVFKHAHTYPITMQERRRILEMLNSRILTPADMTQRLIDLMWGTVTDAVNGVRSKIDMIFLGALSNEGVFTFNDTTNPEGGVKGTVNYQMPASNKGVATVQWTEANIATVDCFADIQTVVNAAANKTVFSEIWIDQSKLNYMLRTAKMKLTVLGDDRKASPLMISQLNEFMRSNDLPVFRVIRRQTMVMGRNGALTPYTPFNAKNLVFVPSGNLGIIKNSYADSELEQEQGVSYSNFGRIRISQWGVGEVQGSNRVDFTKAESLSLPVITAINGVYSLKTEN